MPLNSMAPKPVLAPLASAPLLRPIPLRPASAGKDSISPRPDPEAQRPQTAPGDMGHAPRSQGNPRPADVGVAAPKPEPGDSLRQKFPHYDERAHYQYESLKYIEDHPDMGLLDMWNNGSVPFFPTAERKPTATETAAFRDFASQVNAHRQDAVHSGLPLDSHLHRMDPLRHGEYGAMYALSNDAAPVRQEFKYNPENFLTLAAGPSTKMVIHSHPINPRPGPVTIDDLAKRMPSVTDHQQASLDRMKSGADNYLVVGDRVSHFDGTTLAVTELRPSPLAGKLPGVTF